MEKGLYYRTARFLWVTLFTTAALALVSGGYWYYRSETERIRAEKYQEIAAIGALKSGQIKQWRQERLSDISRSSRSPFFGPAIREWIRDTTNTSLQAKIQDRLVSDQKEEGYADVLLLDTQGGVLLSAEPHPHPLSPPMKKAIEQALANRAPMLSELYRCPEGIVHVDAFGPILDAEGQPVAVLVLRSNAESLLFPLIQSWPTPSKTAETLVVRKEGEELLFLNDLRHRPNSALSLRHPLTLRDLPAVQAVLGKEGIFRGRDYRGVEVLADLRPIPDSPWFMVAKVDASEILAEARYRGAIVALFAALFLVLTASVTAYGYRRRQVGLYRDLYRTERERRMSQEEFRTTLYSIGDAVITTDTGGLVKQMNPVAEQLTGWSETEARGRLLDKVFHIINEESRDIAENPVQRVLREGIVVGLANHTLLVSRDGAERPIADSGAPIRHEKGAISGVVLVFRDQTEERAAQKALEQQYQEILESQRHAAFLADLIERSSQALGVGYPDGRLGTVNEAFCRLTGYSKSELAAMDWTKALTPPEWREIELSKLEELRRTSQPVRYEKEYVGKDGGRVPIELLVHMVKDESGAPQYYYAFINDITDRKEAEEALRESQERLRTIFETSPAGIFLVNPEGRITFVNRRMGDLFCRRPEELIDTPYINLVHPSQRSIGSEKMKSLMAGEIDHVSLERRYVADGERNFVGHLSGRRFLRPDGSLDGLVGIITDITDLKTAEESLHETMELMQYIVRNDPNAIAVFDRDLHYLAVSNRYLLDYNVKEEDIIGRHHYEVFPEIPQRWKDVYQGCLLGAVESEDDDYFERPDGSITFNRWECRPWYSSSNEIGGIITYTEVTTERKLAEKALKASEARYRHLFNSSPIGIISVDAQGRILEVNRPVLDILGSPSVEATKGINMFELPQLIESGISDAFRSCVTTGERAVKEVPYLSKWGKQSYLRIVLTPVTDEQRTVRGCQATVEDITQQRALEQHLRQAQKMEAVGTLAGGVAHDFNNILQVVLGYSDLILSDEQFPERFRDDLEKVNQAARNGADLVSRLLMFSRKSEINPLSINLNRRIEQLQKMLSRTIPKMIEIELVLADDLPSVHADPTQVDQVLMNLAVNARDAMPEGGRLTIQTENVTLDEEYARTHLDAKEGPYVLLSVSDTGQGMDRETVQHIFEPFFTTKEPGEGTGLGLAMVYGIVKQHGGHIMCYSEPGKGTVFRMYFPALVSDEELLETETTTVPRGGSETILLVDDEEVIRELGERILTKAGYTVIQASNGKEALEIYQARSDDISLVILDLIMPEMGGKQCLEELLKIDPQVKVLIASGYSAAGRTKEAGAKGFVNKPYNIGLMLEAVRDVLDSDQGSRP